MQITQVLLRPCREHRFTSTKKVLATLWSMATLKPWMRSSGWTVLWMLLLCAQVKTWFISFKVSLYWVISHIITIIRHKHISKKIQRFASLQVDNKYVQPSILTGNKIFHVSLTATPRTAISRNLPFALTKSGAIDAAYCDTEGVYLFIGSKYYHYMSVTVMVWSKINPVGKPITSEMMGCQD